VNRFSRQSSGKPGTGRPGAETTRAEDGPSSRGRHIAPPRFLRSRYLAAVTAGVLAATVGVAIALGGDSAGDGPEAGAGTGEFGTAPEASQDASPGSRDPHRGADPGDLSSQAPPGSGEPGGSGGPSGPAGWPGPENTGVPAGTQLTASGSVTVTQNGAVLSGLDITGCVDVQASDVTITASRITCDRADDSAIRVQDGGEILLEDVEIDGTGVTGATICCGNYTIRRANIHNTIDGPRLGSNTLVEDSWIHHLARVEGSHNDALQTNGGSNIVVRNNRLEAYNPETDDPFNAAIMIGSESVALSDLLFEDNYCNGGNYTIGLREDTNAANVVIRRNTFGHDHRYGVVARTSHPGVTWEASTNVYEDTGDPVTES
jgi:hypothetical protein